jgi:hypothetical protein
MEAETKGPFENEAARAWLQQVTDASDDSVLRSALEPVAATPEDAPLGATEAYVAVAAAEVVAAIAGEGGWELPEPIRDWGEGLMVDVGPLIRLARDAVARVNSGSSELKEQWESTNDTQWPQMMFALERRLGTA